MYDIITIGSATMDVFVECDEANVVSVFSKEKWIEIIERNGFQMLNEIHLTPENCPPNFPFESTY